MTARDEFFAALRQAAKPDVAPPELAALRPARGGELVDQFIAAAERAGAHVHRGVDADEVVAGRTADEVGVSRAAYGLADTGSVVLLAGPDEPRGRSLLPPVHVALVAADSLLPGLPELFAELGPDLSSSVAIVTGPSSSGDIEQ